MKGGRRVYFGALRQQANENEKDEEGAQREQVHAQINRAVRPGTRPDDRCKNRERRGSLIVQPTDFDGLVSSSELVKVEGHHPFEPLEGCQAAFDGLVGACLLYTSPSPRDS